MRTKRPKLWEWDSPHQQFDDRTGSQPSPLNEAQLEEYVNLLCPPWALTSAKQCDTPKVPHQLGKLG